MPTSHFFGFAVSVGNKALKEYEQDRKWYIEANLNTPESYNICETVDQAFAQSPVTPYQINIWKEQSRQPCFFNVYVDGEKIYGRPCDERKNQFTVSGYRNACEISELLFTLPKMSEGKAAALSEERRQELGSIRVECYDARVTGTRFRERQQFKTHMECVLADGAGFTRATKKGTSKPSDALISTMVGRNVGYFQNSGERVKQTTYSQERRVGDIMLHYRPRHILQELGIQDKEWAVPEHPTELCAGPVKTELDVDYNNTSTPIGKLGLFSPSNKKIGMFSPSDHESGHRTAFHFSEKMNCYTPSALKRESITNDLDMLNSDDELDCIIEADNSIIFMGDQSCCIVEPEEEQQMCIDLSS